MQSYLNLELIIIIILQKIFFNSNKYEIKSEMAVDTCRGMPGPYLQFRLCAYTVHGILLGSRTLEWQENNDDAATNQITVRVYMRLGQSNQLCKTV